MAVRHPCTSSFMRVVAVILGLLAGAGWSGRALAEEPIKIGALFAVTGGASFLGEPEKKTAEMLVEKLNKSGGILGRQVQLIILDTQGAPEKATAMATQLIQEHQVLAIIGPSTSGESMAIKGLCQENQVPLISCAAAEKIVNPLATYVFKTPQNDAFAAKKIYAQMKAMKLTKIAIVSANDGFGKAGREQLQKLAPEFGLTILADEAYGKEDTDLTALVTKLKATGAEAVVNWSIVPAQAIIAKNMKQIGFNVPLFQSHGFGNIKYVEMAGPAAEGIIFPCGRLLIAESLPDGQPQKALLVAYKKEYETRYKENASTFGGHAYDAVLILTEALKKAGAADRAKVRDAIEGLKGLQGTAGEFNFAPADHNGLTIDAFEMLTVKDGKFVKL
jgi:branched-chain amino acid transport system substrate-binding protein